MTKSIVFKVVLLGALVLFAAPRAALAQTEEGSPAPAEPAAGGDRAGEWQLEVGMGGEFFVFLDQVVGNGLALKLAAQRVGWFGHFMLGGGPSFQYSYLIESDKIKDEVHQLTINGDFLIGGGTFETFAVYLHLMAGFGGAHVYDGDTKEKMWLPWFRAVGGVGGWFHLTPLVSLGVVVDVGFPGIVDALLVVGFHVGKK